MTEPAVRVATMLLTASSKIRLYGREHPLAVAAIGELWDHLQRFWAEHRELRIAIEGSEVQIQGRAVAPGSGPAEGLYRRLHERGIGFLRLAPALRREALTDFCAELGDAGDEPMRSHPGIEVGAPWTEAEPLAPAMEIARIQSPRGKEDRPAPEEALELAQLGRRARERYEVKVQDYRQIALSLVSHLTTQGNLFLHLAEIRDHNLFTYLHTCNVGLLSMAMGARLGLSRREVFDLGVAALLHDLGKSFVPEEILEKPGRLTSEEWKVIRRHPEDGARLLLEQPRVHHLAVVVAYEHHMRFDGDGGYPRAPYRPSPSSQLVAIADTFDALFGKRSYHRRYDVVDALEILRSQRGRAYDPELVDIFERMVGEDLEEVSKNEE